MYILQNVSTFDNIMQIRFYNYIKNNVTEISFNLNKFCIFLNRYYSIYQLNYCTGAT